MVSPMSPPKARAGDWWGAVLLPLFMPAIGLIAGIVYVAMGRERRDPGWLCLGLSIAACILWFAALSGNQ